MIIDIAGLPIAVTVRGTDAAARLQERYGAFLAASGVPVFDLELTVDAERHPARCHPTFVDNPAQRAEGDLAAAYLAGDGFEGEFDWKRGHAQATIPDSLAHIDLFLRVALGVALLRGGDTLLHAAGAVRDQFGVVFSGPSGAGKSTIAGLCAQTGVPVLADEMLVVRRLGSGTRVFGTPFWNGRPQSAPLGALFFLAHGPDHRAARIKPTDALPLLLKAGGAPLALPSVQQAFFDACAEVLRRVAPYRLTFAPIPTFWSAIDRLPEFAFFRPKPRSPGARLAPSGPPPRPLGTLRRT